MSSKHTLKTKSKYCKSRYETQNNTMVIYVYHYIYNVYVYQSALKTTI